MNFVTISESIPPLTAPACSSLLWCVTYEWLARNTAGMLNSEIGKVVLVKCGGSDKRNYSKW